MPSFFRRTFSSLGIRNYRLFFIGQAVSMTGTFMQTIGQSWLVLQLTHSGSALGLTVALQYLPVLLFGSWGGVIADRFPKRTLLYLTQTAFGLQALLLGLLVLTGTVQLWMVCALAAVFGFINVVDNPARQTFVFQMVGESKLKNAVTLNATLNNISRIIGPAIAGILIATVGLPLCFLINAASYIAVLVVLWMMRARDFHILPVVPYTKGLLREGFRYVRSHQEIFDALLMMAVVGTFTYEFQVSLPLIADNLFHTGASGYAAMTTAMGVGSIIGGLVIASRKRGSISLLVASAGLLGLSVVLASVMPTFTLSLLLLIVVGAFSVHFTSLSNSILQLSSAPAMRGRVMSLWAIAFLGSTTIGGPIVGWVGEFFGPRWGLAIGGIAALVAAVIGRVTLRTRSFAMESSDPAVGAATIRSEQDVRIP